MIAQLADGSPAGRQRAPMSLGHRQGDIKSETVRSRTRPTLPLEDEWAAARSEMTDQIRVRPRVGVHRPHFNRDAERMPTLSAHLERRRRHFTVACGRKVWPGSA
ncbi:hypothetical protein E1287_18860 [Actinomadura sp. KC06]|uniref:hypothetical protein n=1 Tax=Actinomadura sp. KC06 TaxID=2530369 RepID=UPI0010519220|nr:hypothetical protein [Actinomadura sp. KC06]TDD33637.1 hypothetical protein E1287_18860 [Actinomadura sp. KC06]